MRKVALTVAVVLASTLFMAPWSHGATLSTPLGLPIFQFVNSGSGPLPWNAVSLESSLHHVMMLGGPHTASSPVAGALAYRTTSSHVALYTRTANGSSQWVDLSPQINAPDPAADPIPFFDPSGAVDVLYVDATGHVIILSANIGVTALWHHVERGGAWRPLVGTDLTALTGVVAANGLASIRVTGQSALVAFRTVTNAIEAVPLTWDAGQPLPYLAGPATNVTKVTAMGSASSDPTVVGTTVPSIAATSMSGDVELYAPTASATRPWTVQDLTASTFSAKVVGTLTSAATATTAYVTALSVSGNVELLSAPVSASSGGTTTTSTSTTTTAGTSGTTTTVVASGPWSALNVSAAAKAPPLSGSLFLDVTPTQITIAGPAANWGDLFALSNSGLLSAWVATDVSVTAGSAARTVGGVVTGFHVGTPLDLFAAGISSPPKQGVGVYAIPSSKWGKAVADGWPIISETGGLGTQSSPWVGFTTSGGVAMSPDYLIGQSIYNSHKRVTWLSFWTASGPQANEPKKPATYYNHGFTAGAWVASQIDQYRGLGVGLKPDWVIFDPEGYPDNHSGLDAPGGSSLATIRLYASYWSAMLAGWAQGIVSVDPSLNAGVYASQSEYRNYSLVTQSLPVFVAVAFGGNGPVPVAGASGSNIRGFIAFSAVCSPKSSLKTEENTLLNPPWAGQFNTLQFNAGVYCPPA